MTKKEFIEILNKHIVRANRMQSGSKNEFEAGKWAGIRQEAEEIIKLIGGLDDKK